MPSPKHDSFRCSSIVFSSDIFKMWWSSQLNTQHFKKCIIKVVCLKKKSKRGKSCWDHMFSHSLQNLSSSDVFFIFHLMVQFSEFYLKLLETILFWQAAERKCKLATQRCTANSSVIKLLTDTIVGNYNSMETPQEVTYEAISLSKHHLNS